MVEYHQHKFLFIWADIKKRIVEFFEDGLQTRPSGLIEGRNYWYQLHMIEVYLVPIMEKKRYRKKKENYLYNQKKKEKNYGI